MFKTVAGVGQKSMLLNRLQTCSAINCWRDEWNHPLTPQGNLSEEIFSYCCSHLLPRCTIPIRNTMVELLWLLQTWKNKKIFFSSRPVPLHLYKEAVHCYPGTHLSYIVSEMHQEIQMDWNFQSYISSTCKAKKGKSILYDTLQSHFYHDVYKQTHNKVLE